jgi:Ribbon-helix-helix protein, copG family
MAVTTISLTQDELKTLKHIAVERGTTLRDLVREALAPLLKGAKKGGRQ